MCHYVRGVVPSKILKSESWKRNHQLNGPNCPQLAAYNGASGPLSPYEDKQRENSKDSYEQYKYVQLQIFGKGKILPRE